MTYMPQNATLKLTPELKHLDNGKPSRRDEVLAALCQQTYTGITAGQWVLTKNAMELYPSDVRYFKHHGSKPAQDVACMLTNNNQENWWEK